MEVLIAKLNCVVYGLRNTQTDNKSNDVGEGWWLALAPGSLTHAWSFLVHVFRIPNNVQSPYMT